MQKSYAAALLGLKGIDPLSPVLSWRMTTACFPASNDDEARGIVLRTCGEVWKVSDGFQEHHVSIMQIPDKLINDLKS